MDGDMHMCMTHVGLDAAWRNTIESTLPWAVTPNYANIIGFQLMMMMPDLLHVFNLGVAKHMLASSLKVVLSEQVVFQASNLVDRMSLATASLKQFALRRGLPLRIKKITKSRLKWKNRKYPELGASGYDAYVVGSWLESVLEPFSQRYPDIVSLLWVSNRTVSLMYSAGWFLTPGEKQTLETLGGLFNHLYMKLASQAVNQHKLLFRVIPKFHLFCHITSSRRDVNPSKYSTWMDEDFLKKIGKCLGLTSLRTAQKRLLERWLMSIPLNLQRDA